MFGLLSIQSLFNARFVTIPVEGTVLVLERMEVQASLRYRAYARHLYGVLGRGARICCPQCIIPGIHELAPHSVGVYTGHRDPDDEI